MDGCQKSWIYVIIFVPPVLEPPVCLLFTLLFLSLYLHPDRAGERCVPKQTATTLFQLESLNPHCFSPAACCWTIGGCFLSQFSSCFSLDLDHVPRPWSSFIVDSDRSGCPVILILKGWEAFQSNFELKLRVLFFHLIKHWFLKPASCRDPRDFLRKVTRTERREKKD